MQKPRTLYIVILVESGIPSCVEAYKDLKTTELREKSIRKEINLDNDETGIFEIEI